MSFRVRGEAVNQIGELTLLFGEDRMRTLDRLNLTLEDLRDGNYFDLNYICNTLAA